MCQIRNPVSFLVQVIWYWGISHLVLKYLITETALEANILIKVHFDATKCKLEKHF